MRSYQVNNEQQLEQLPANVKRFFLSQFDGKDPFYDRGHKYVYEVHDDFGELEIEQFEFFDRIVDEDGNTVDSHGNVISA